MKDVNVLSAKGEKINRSDILSAVIFHIAAAVAGFIFCRTVFFEKYMPFGISFAAGCPAAVLPSAAAGVFIGCFFPAINAVGFRYVAAALAVFAVRFMLSFNKKLNSAPLFAALISFLSMAVTCAVTFGGVGGDALYLSLETLICAAAAIIMSRTFSFITNIYGGLDSEQIGCLIVTFTLFLGGLYSVSVFGVNISCIIAVAFMLSAGKYGGAFAGTVSSIAAALVFLLAGRDAGMCIIYTVCAMVAGLVSSYGKYVQLCAFFTCGVVFSLTLGMSNMTAAFIAEIMLGSIIFAFMPKRAGIYLGKILACFPHISVNNDLNRAVTMRLKEASIGIRDVKTTVDEVSTRLEGINTPGFSGVLGGIESEVCDGCKLRMHCWQARRDATLDAVFAAIKQIKTDGAADEKNLPAEFRGRCIKADKFCVGVSRNYLRYSSAVAANGRIGEIRRAVTDQFEGISIMLDELSDSFSGDVTFDNSAALTAVTALKNIGVCADECSAPVDKYGRMKINLKLARSNETVLNKRDIMKVLSLSCERDFAPPAIKKTSGETFISVTERAALKVDVGVWQKSAETGDMCGDAYSYFFDGQGHFIMILSDGMGTGGRAAVDSAMASGLIGRLIKSGFGFDCALRILNSSMLFKSADESLATIDIASIDLYDGNTELYKAGAAPTVVRRNGRSGKAVSTSMPVGILSDVAFDRAGIKLSPGDILVLISDGAAFCGTDWLRDEIERFSSGSAQDLAERLCECAARRRNDGHADDITVMAAIIDKVE